MESFKAKAPQQWADASINRRPAKHYSNTDGQVESRLAGVAVREGTLAAAFDRLID